MAEKGLNNGAVVFVTDGLKEKAEVPKVFEPNNEFDVPNPLTPAVTSKFQFIKISNPSLES